MTSLEVKYLPSSLSGQKLHTLVWSPEKPRAIVQIVHGMAEHIARYDEFARWLCEKGIAVIGHSHLGHGLTAASAEDFGFIANKDGWLRLVDDVHVVRTAAQELFPGLPHILLGHSMGSFVTRTYITRPEAAGLEGVVISGTGNMPGAVVGAGNFVASIIQIFKGKRHRSALMNAMSFGSYNNAFKPTRTESDWLSRNEENVDKYVADPMCGFCFTLRAFRDLFYGLSYIGNKKNIAKMRKSLPCMFIAGQLDPVGNNGKGVVQVADMFRKAGMTDVRVELYDNDRHEVLNEIDRETVYNDVYGFIGRFIPEAESAAEACTEA